MARLFARPLRTFLNTEAAGGIVLLAATVVALVWVNSPFGDSYESFWHTTISLSVGGSSVAMDLRHFVNDGLMALFFFVVGLEIKRELVAGELSDRRKAALPALAAVGGMVVPALIYLVLNLGGPGASGWGIPMATDIAFAVGVLTLLGDRVAPGLKLFLLSLAIVDDIGAIVVIALFYSSGLELGWLAFAVALVVFVLLIRRVRVLWLPIYIVLGIVIWFATFQSGVHATIAGVALGLLAPARPTDPGGFSDVVERASSLPSEPDAESVRAVSLQAQEVVSVAERQEHLLHPWSSYLIVPVFALANAGIELSASSLGDALTSRITLGIVAGLVVGKIVGVSAMSWLAIRTGVGVLPDQVSMRDLLGAGAVAGIGFTVSLFITGLAFSDPELVEVAKMGVLLASVLAGAIGVLAFRSEKLLGGQNGLIEEEALGDR